LAQNFIKLAAATILLSTFSGKCSAEMLPVLRIIIETRILDFDPQAGMKSTHTADIAIDTTASNFVVSNSFRTGTTDFFGIKLDSVRDNFKIGNLNSSIGENSHLSFTISGETASGVRILPNINYKFDFSVDVTPSSAHYSISGCHDGYPAYQITVVKVASGQSKVIYDYQHKSKELMKLFGSCDVSMSYTK
jgi:hypothetical protein